MAEEKENSEANKNLFDAVEKGDEQLVKVLLQNKNQKVNIDFQEKPKEWTPLHKAAFNNFEQIVKILLEHGANVELPNQVLIFLFFLLLLSFSLWG